MTRRLLLGRLVLVAVGIVVWGCGQRADLPRTRIAGIAILAVSLLLRFIPSRWTGDDAAAPTDRGPQG